MLHELLGLKSSRNQHKPHFPNPFIITPTSLIHFDIHNLITFVYKNYFSENKILQLIANKIQDILTEYFYFISNEKINKETIIIFIEKRYERSSSFYCFLYENPLLLLKLKPFIIRISNLNYFINSLNNNESYNNIINIIYNIQISSEEINLIKINCKELINKKISNLLFCEKDLLENIKESNLFLIENEIPFQESYFENFLNLKLNKFLENKEENILFCLKYKIYRLYLNKPLPLNIFKTDISILTFELKTEMKKFMKNNLIEFLNEIKSVIFFQLKKETKFLFLKEIPLNNNSIFNYFSSLFNLKLLDLPQSNIFIFKNYELFIQMEFNFFLSEKSKNELLISFKLLRLINQIRFNNKIGRIGFIEKNFWESIWFHLITSCLKELEIFKLKIENEEISIINIKDFIFSLIKKLFLTSSDVINILLDLLNLSYSNLDIRDFKSLFFENILKLKSEIEFDGRNVFLWAYLDLISIYLI